MMKTIFAILDTEYKTVSKKPALISELAVIKYDYHETKFEISSCFSYNNKKDTFDLFENLYHWLVANDIETILIWGNSDYKILKRAKSQYVKLIVESIVFFDLQLIYKKRKDIMETKLKDVFLSYGFSKQGIKFHRALDDCRATGMILDSFVQEIGVSDFNTSITDGNVGRQNFKTIPKIVSMIGSEITPKKLKKKAAQSSIKTKKGKIEQQIPFANIVTKERSKLGLSNICVQCGNKIRFKQKWFNDIERVSVSCRERFVADWSELIRTDKCTACRRNRK